jgi:hypothetical protein
LEPASNVTLDRRVQSKKQPHPKVSTEDGMQIDGRDLHSANAQSPMREHFEGDRNTTVERARQPSKQESPIASTEPGMQADDSFAQAWKVLQPKHPSCEPDSNVTRRTDERRKALSPIARTEQGI